MSAEGLGASSVNGSVAAPPQGASLPPRTGRSASGPGGPQPCRACAAGAPSRARRPRLRPLPALATSERKRRTEPRGVRDSVRLEGRAARDERAGVGRRDHLRLTHGAPSSRLRLGTRSPRRAALHGAGPHARRSRRAHGPEGGVVGARQPPMWPESFMALRLA